ncbi:hypothetical protein K501DRAFT_238279 [Backusella circina FSU 941]|nr:hypothetical protein K501DRAFT_238279 [Backusella circina FSU 941]
MKDDFRAVEIEPTETTLDFIGPAKPEQIPARTLKGQIRFSLAKQTKIKAMSIKFKGFSENNIEAPHAINIKTPLLPKLKVSLFGKITLPAGEQVIPWEIDIPNLYPRSLAIKRSRIYYKVVVSISVGLARTVTAECPITIRRHLLPYKELSPFIETKLHQRTIPSKFHFEIDAPQLICSEQEFIPMAIKYVTFANHKPVQAIRTRLIQIEHHRRQPLSKSDSDLSFCNPDSLVLDLSQKISDAFFQKDTHIKFAKKTEPALIHTPDNSTNFWKRPCLIRHLLHPSLSYTLNSPLVSIYHQLEVTFQFGMRFEEIKANIPIIIASVPVTPSAVAGNEATMKYPFEESAKNKFLPYQMESPSSKNRSKYAYSDDMNQDDPIELDLEHLSSELIRPGKKMHAATKQNLSRRQAPFPSSKEPDSFNVRGRTVRKFASAFDLSSESRSSMPIINEEEERPRTTTPTRGRRDPAYKKKPRPIDVELANQFDRIKKQPFPPRKDPPKKPPPPPPINLESVEHSSSSGALPVIDRSIMKSQSSAYVPSGEEKRKNKMWLLDRDFEGSNEDLYSVYSENSASSKTAPSLSSSGTASTNKSHHTLLSRPPSPVFSPAPGLPATIPLRPQEYGASQVEEFFSNSNISTSPTMTTVASSAVLSPRSSYSHQQRIALSTISSFTNDSLYLGSAIYSKARSSSTIDPETHSWLAGSDGFSIDSGVPAPIRYLHAKLPPIPSSRDPNKRHTKYYLDDSDDDEMEHPLEIPVISELRNTPPILPRLSFGRDFSISLGLD